MENIYIHADFDFLEQVGADTSGQKGTIGCAARAKTSKDSQQL